jgi:hypothetical protein
MNITIYGMEYDLAGVYSDGGVAAAGSCKYRDRCNERKHPIYCLAEKRQHAAIEMENAAVI